MPEDLRAQLEKKHWSEEEIDQALRIMTQSRLSADKHTQFYNQVIYWIALFLSLVGNFVLNIILVPFIVLAEEIYLYPGLFVLAIMFGALFDLIVYDIEKIEEAPKFKPGLFLFGIALINIFMIVQMGGYFKNLIGYAQPASVSWVIISIYSLGFMIPYFYTRRKGIFESFSKN